MQAFADVAAAQARQGRLAGGEDQREQVAIEVAGGFMSKWLYVEQLFDEATIDHLNALYCLLIERLADGDWAAGLPRDAYLPDADRALIEAANAAGAAPDERTLFASTRTGTAPRAGPRRPPSSTPAPASPTPTAS